MNFDTGLIYSLKRLLAGVEPDVLDERLLPLEHAVAVRALEVGRLVLQVVLPQLTRVPEALLTNLAEMPAKCKMWYETNKHIHHRLFIG